MAKQSQRDLILQYLESGNSITQMEAIEMFGCTRLAARINELRDAGYPIKSKMISSKSRYGVPISYCQYSIQRE